MAAVHKPVWWQVVHHRPEDKHLAELFPLRKSQQHLLGKLVVRAGILADQEHVEHMHLLEMVIAEADHMLMDLVVFFGPAVDHTPELQMESHNWIVRLEALHNQVE